ncbi:hypothetical protein [Clostridiisalibacter paucivorans]|uniref:hypothetical protein n=1 Tax=Clostridiisalibacter paucivorans TaxID=408753 RepID=UPI00146FA951|nr:hypothetical protein [Clostridiisalibacter paucivorans]
MKKDLDKSKLPIDLKYLFENKYIECMQTLLILFLLKRRRKGIEIEELLYYFTLLCMTTIKANNEFFIDETYIQNNYLTLEKVVRDNILILSNHNYINVKIKSTKKKNKMYIKISDDGKEVVKNLENNFFEKEKEKIKYLTEKEKFSVENQRKVLRANEN